MKTLPLFERLSAVVLAAALILSVSGCQTEDLSFDGMSFRAGQTVTIRADFENVTEPTTKTTLHSDGHVYWTPGDAISLFYGSGDNGGSRFVSDLAADDRVSSFSGNISAVTGVSESSADQLMFWGLYPYDPEASCDGQTVTTTIKSVQEGMADTFAPGYAPSLGRAPGLLLSFRNIYSGLWFTVTCEGFKSATFKSNAGEPVAGRVKVGIGDDGLPCINQVLEGVSSVTVTAPGGGTFEVGKKYYVLFIPQLLTGGFTLELRSGTETGVFSINSSVNFKRNAISSVDNLDTKCTFTSANALVVFEDDNFKAYCVEKYDKDSDGEISMTEASKIGSVFVNTATITSLKGIEHFKNLRSLSCTLHWDTTSFDSEGKQHFYNADGDEIYGLLTSLDVSHNTALTFLSCYDNQLTSLDVSHNTALTSLSCSNNLLTSLDVSHNTALSRLSCADNLLTSLDVSQNTALTSLLCGNNPLTGLDVSHNTALTELRCHSCQLSNLKIGQNTALTLLVCSFNQFTGLNVSQCTALTELNCSYNQLTSLNVANNTALTTLKCSDNQLTSLDVSHNTALGKLDCSSNLLTTLDVSNCTALTELICSSNPYLTELWLKSGQEINRFLYNSVLTILKYRP